MAQTKSASLTQVKVPIASAEIGKLVREARTLSGISEVLIANYLEIPVDTLLAYELGKKPIPLNHVYALSNRLNISPERIVRLINQFLNDHAPGARVPLQSRKR